MLSEHISSSYNNYPYNNNLSKNVYLIIQNQEKILFINLTTKKTALGIRRGEQEIYLYFMNLILYDK